MVLPLIITVLDRTHSDFGFAKICFSGCEDNQTSADTVQGGLAVGAMSYAFIKCLSVSPVEFLSFQRVDSELNVPPQTKNRNSLIRNY